MLGHQHHPCTQQNDGMFARRGVFLQDDFLKYLRDHVPVIKFICHCLDNSQFMKARAERTYGTTLYLYTCDIERWEGQFKNSSRTKVWRAPFTRALLCKMVKVEKFYSYTDEIEWLSFYRLHKELGIGNMTTLQNTSYAKKKDNFGNLFPPKHQRSYFLLKRRTLFRVFFLFFSPPAK